MWKQKLYTAVRSVIREISAKWDRDCAANDWFKSKPKRSNVTKNNRETD